MSKQLFLKVVHNVQNHDNYYQQKLDTTKKMGTSSIQKYIAAIKILAYDFASDACDEYI
jgi:hypothetical protein